MRILLGLAGSLVVCVALAGCSSPTFPLPSDDDYGPAALSPSCTAAFKTRTVSGAGCDGNPNMDQCPNKYEPLPVIASYANGIPRTADVHATYGGLGKAALSKPPTFEAARCGGGNENNNTKRVNTNDQWKWDTNGGIIYDIYGNPFALDFSAAHDFIPSCKDTVRCDSPQYFGGCQFLTAANECPQLGFVNGFMADPPTYQYIPCAQFPGTACPGAWYKQPLGGQHHDGDEDSTVCPFPTTGGVVGEGFQGQDDDPTVLAPQELRSEEGAHSAVDGQMVETPWCRWYGAPISVAGDVDHAPVDFCSFRPNAGDRISAVGDYIVDEPGTELHDARIFAAVRADPIRAPNDCSAQECIVDQGGCLESGTGRLDCSDPTRAGCQHPDTWHILVSGEFTKDSIQSDRLDITVPIPPPYDPNHTRLDPPTIPTLTLGGCEQGVIPSISCTEGVTPDHSDAKCTISLVRTTAPQSERNCSAEDVCPCVNRDDWGVENCRNDGWDYNELNACNPSDESHIAFARDIRVDWVDPEDAWECQCECDDPASASNPFVAKVQGCAPSGLADDEPDDIETACSAVCSGAPKICTGPNCQIGSCHARSPDLTDGRKLLVNACEEAPPTDRTSTNGDYVVNIDPSKSVAILADVDSNHDFSEDARSSAIGRVTFALDSSGDHITVSDLEVKVADFSAGNIFGSADFSQLRSIALDRFVGTKTTLDDLGTVFVVKEVQAKFAVGAAVNGVPGTTAFPNYGPLYIRIDQSANTFELLGQGDNNAGNGVILSLKGAIVDHPPNADPGPSGPIECTSPAGATVHLDGSASRDPDPGDQILRAQWFEGATPLSGAISTSVPAGLGPHSYELHVYDKNLGSGGATKQVDVMDTTGPTLNVPSGPFCLWPPNHEFAMFTLSELGISASDVCDPNPTVRFKEIVSSQPDDAAGSGDTSPDTLFGSDTACVRAERSGVAGQRTYLVTVEARDRSGNASQKSFEVVVPHDQSGSDQCMRVTGLDNLTESCQQ